MKTRVTALVPADIVEITENSASSIPEMALVTDIYRNPREAVGLFAKHIEESDVILFGGPLAYQFVQNHINVQGLRIAKPMVYFPYTEVSIYRALFKVSEAMSGTPHPPLSLSIDYPAASEIRESLDELEISIGRAFPRECTVEVDFDELVRFHHELWRSGRVQVCLSSMHLVYDQLAALGVPVYRISPAKSSIRNAMQQALLEGKSSRQAESQIAIGIIGLETSGEGYASSAYQAKRTRLGLEQLLLDFGEELQALINWGERNELRFVTTRGQIERITQRFRQVPLLAEIQQRVSAGAYMGIGFGNTANEAEMKAYEAAAKAKAFGSGSCFVVELSGNVTGPIGEGAQLDYSVRSEDPELLAVARAAGLSIGTVNKLAAFVEKSGGNQFTAGELACAFGITLRSARRILTRLEESTFVKVSGEEQPVSRGRPRRLYSAAFRRAE